MRTAGVYSLTDQFDDGNRHPIIIAQSSLSVKYRSIWCMNLYNKIGLVVKEVRHGLHLSERSGVKGETLA